MREKCLKYGIILCVLTCLFVFMVPKQEDVKSAQNILTVTYDSNTLEKATLAAASGNSLTEYTGFVVKGSKELTGTDFGYMSKKWKHAESIDLSRIPVEEGMMGDSFEPARTLGQDEDANSTKMQLKEFYFPKNTKTFNGTVLNDLKNLEEIRLPDSLESLGQALFYGLPKLNKISYHGTAMKNFTTASYTFSGCPLNRTLDFSNAYGLEQITLYSSTAVSGFDFTGLNKLTKVNMSGQNIDFSGGKEKEWLDAFEGIKDISKQKPLVKLSCDPVPEIELNGVFQGPPDLKAKLKDGTDILGQGPLPDWIAQTYPSDLKKVTVTYQTPSGSAENTIDTSIGGKHKIQWKINYTYGNPMSNEIFSTHVSVIIPESAKTDQVYVKDGGSGSGASEDQPIGSVEEAIGYLKKNGTIYLTGDARLPENFLIPMDMKFAGVQGKTPILYLGGDLYLKGSLALKNLSLKADSETDIYACGKEFATDENVTTADGSKNINLYGGGTEAVVSDTKISLLGGSFQRVFGGGYLGGGHGYTNENSKVDGNVEILIGKNAKVQDLFGGGHLVGAPGLEKPDVSAGDVKIYIQGGSAESVYGGGFGSAGGTASVKNVKIVMESGKVGYIYGGGKASGVMLEPVTESQKIEIELKGNAQVTNAVYGGGKAVSVGKADAGNTLVSVSENAEIKNIYGSGCTEGGRQASAKVKNAKILLGGGKVTGAVYGAGRYSKSGDYDPNSNVGVEQDVDIRIQNTDISNASIYADGAVSGIVGGKKSIHLDGYGTASAYKKVNTIGYFDTLTLGEGVPCYLEFPSNIEPNLTSDSGCENNIVLKNGSSLSFQKNVSGSFKVGNLTAEGTGTSAIKLQKNAGSSAIPLYINGKIQVQTPIQVEVTGNSIIEGDLILASSNSHGNDSLTSSKFSLKNSGFKLLKQNSVLTAADMYSTQKEDQDPPSGLEGIMPGRYNGSDGKIANLTERMEVSVDKMSYVPYTQGMTFPPGTYWIRYRGGDQFNASEPVQVIVPQGKHPIQYHIMNGKLKEGAPKQVEHGGEFEFQTTADEGYELDLSRTKAEGGILSYQSADNKFTVKNVSGDVNITVYYKMTPLKLADSMIKRHVYIPYGTKPGTAVSLMENGGQGFPDSVDMNIQAEDLRGFLILNEHQLLVHKINESKEEITIPVCVLLEDPTGKTTVDAEIHFLPRKEKPVKKPDKKPDKKKEEDKKNSKNQKEKNLKKPLRVRKKTTPDAGDHRQDEGWHFLLMAAAGVSGIFLCRKLYFLV